MAKISIITRTKDRPILLERAVKSVIHQSFADWEHVIVNDGGNPDNVNMIVAQFSTEYAGRIKVIHNPTSVGMEEASNIGIRDSAGEYLVIHDDDDSWDNMFLLEMLETIEKERKKNAHIRGIACQSMRIDEQIEGNEVKILKTKPYNPKLLAASLLEMSGSNQFPPISFIFARKAAEEIGLFNKDLEVLGDWDFHLRFLKQYDIAILPKVLANYHHRKITDGSYGNSVTAAQNKHISYKASYTNELLRETPLQDLVFRGAILNEIKKDNKNQENFFKKLKKYMIIFSAIQIFLLLILMIILL